MLHLLILAQYKLFLCLLTFFPYFSLPYSLPSFYVFHYIFTFLLIYFLTYLLPK